MPTPLPAPLFCSAAHVLCPHAGAGAAGALVTPALNSAAFFIVAANARKNQGFFSTACSTTLGVNVGGGGGGDPVGLQHAAEKASAWVSSVSRGFWCGIPVWMSAAVRGVRNTTIQHCKPVIFCSFMQQGYPKNLKNSSDHFPLYSTGIYILLRF